MDVEKVAVDRNWFDIKPEYGGVTPEALRLLKLRARVSGEKR